jgi:small subunit ribosomal protein S4
MAKCAIERGKAAPGVHGARRQRKMSEYGLQLREKQKLRRQYGLQEGQFRLSFDRAMKGKGVTGERLLQILETRLDNLVYRLGFAPSRRSARLFVTHGHIRVNGRKATIPSMNVPEGATIAVAPPPKSRASASRSLEMTAGVPVPAWLTIDKESFAGKLERIPTKTEIGSPIDEQLIVELYSK